MRNPLGHLTRKALQLRCHVLGHKQETFGSCILAGSDELIEKFKEGLLLLQQKDIEIGCGMLLIPWFIYSSGRKSLVNGEFALCGISDAWLIWEVQGIAAYMSYASFCRKYRLQRRELWHREAFIGVADWLREKGFPDEIVDGFVPPRSASWGGGKR